MYLGATIIQKCGIAVWLGGDNNSEQAKCVGAGQELAGSFGVAAAAAPPGFFLALTLASLAPSTINASLPCKWI